MALGKRPADLIIRGATVLDVFTLLWKENQDIVVKGDRIAWVGEAGEAWALATGHNASVLRQNTGQITPGREADLVVMDAPAGSAYPDACAAICGGDLPGISAVIIDGEIKALRSRNTPLATCLCEVREKNGV